MGQAICAGKTPTQVDVESIQFSSFNSRSLRNKTTQVLELLLENNSDICSLSETSLRPGDSAIENEFHERGYSIFHNPRMGRGGGTAIAYRSHLRVTKQTTKRFMSFEVTEALLKANGEQFRICSIYRSSTKSTLNVFLEEFEDYLNSLVIKPGKPIVCGDFNFHLEDDNDVAANRFRSMYLLLGFQQHVSVPTHTHGGCLDLILTYDDMPVDNLAVIDETGTPSDHWFLQFEIASCLNTLPGVAWEKISYRDYKKLDINAVKTDLSNILSDSTFVNLDSTVELFYSTLNTVLEKHAPLSEKFIRTDLQPWWNSDCQRGRRIRRRAERKYNKDKNVANRRNYKFACTKASSIIDAVRNKYYKEKLDEASGNPKRTFAIINKLLNKSKKCKYPSGANDLETANNLQEFFVKKVEKIYDEIREEQSKQETPSNVHQTQACPVEKTDFTNVDHDTLKEVLTEMSSTTCDLDIFPTWLVKACYQELSKILIYIVKTSLQSSCFPSQLKSAIVTPILKKPELDPDDLKSYRPISNLSFVSKLIEKCVHKDLVEYVESHDLFSEYQSGYRKHHSCDTAITRIHNDVLYGDGKQSHQGLLVLLDLSSAFDTLNHELLLNTLREMYGFKGVVLEWLHSYLSGRSFKVKVNKTLSGECYISIGVPQGSILGPLLFILFTKDLESIAKKFGFAFHCYADDCQIYFCFKKSSDEPEVSLSNLSACLMEIKSWMTAHFLKLNDDKTEVLDVYPFYAQAPSVGQVCFDSNVIVSSTSVKSLGVYFDSKLSFERQINEVVKTCSFRLKNLSRIGSKLDPNLKKTLVHSYILSKLDYCNVIYFGANQRLLDKLQSVENAAARFASSTHGFEWRNPGSMCDLLASLHFLPVRYRILYKLCLLCFKCLNNVAPDYLQTLVTVCEPSMYNLRRNDDHLLLDVPDIRSKDIRRWKVLSPMQHQLPGTQFQ